MNKSSGVLSGGGAAGFAMGVVNKIMGGGVGGNHKRKRHRRRQYQPRKPDEHCGEVLLFSGFHDD